MNESIKRNYNKILFVIIIIIGIVIRVYNFPEGMKEINIDEIIAAMNAKEIAETGKDLLGLSYPIYLKGLGGQSVFSLYLMTICIKIFGYTLFSIRLPALIISIIAMFVFYDLIKKISKNKNVALLGLSLLAISPWHILQSMWSWDCNMFPHFLLIEMDILYTGILKNKKIVVYISMIFFAITLYCYGIAIYFVPVFLLIFSIYLIKIKKINIKDLVICIFIFLIFSLPIITMFAINALKIDYTITIFNITIPYYKDLTRTDDMLLFSNNILSQLMQNIIYTFSVIILQNDNVPWNTTQIFGTIYHISLIFAIIGIIFSIKNIRKNKKEDNTKDIILIFWIIISILTGFLVNQTTVNRLNSIWYVLITFAALGIYEVYKQIKYKKTYKYILIIIYTILFISFEIYFYSYHEKQIQQDKCFSNGFMQTLHYINSLEEKNIYYDDTSSIVKLENYIVLNKDNTKNYIAINSRNELKNKINNIEDGEILIVNERYRDYNVSLEKEKIGNFVIAYK